MEVGKRGIVLVTIVLLLVMISGVSSTRYIVSGNDLGWTTNVNYTLWAQTKHFYVGDWFFFVYDRNRFSVLEVNQTPYDQCIESHPIHDWTTGQGMDVVFLKETKRYYFISGKGFCFSRVKLSVLVQNPSPPPTASPPLVENPPPPPTACRKPASSSDRLSKTQLLLRRRLHRTKQADLLHPFPCTDYRDLLFYQQRSPLLPFGTPSSASGSYSTDPAFIDKSVKANLFFIHGGL